VVAVEIYLSWRGEVYGPAGCEEVLAALRTSWFEEETHFWFEGLPVWQPIEAFPEIWQEGPHSLATRPLAEPPPSAPALRMKPSPGNGATPRDQPPIYRGRGSRRHSKRRSWLVVAAFVLLAIAVTVGITLFLMNV